MSEVNQGFEAAIRRGRDFSAAGDWAKALNEYVRAAQINPTDLTARYNIGLALFRLEQLDQAMQQLQGIVRVQPQYADAWQLIAEIQHRNRQIPEAMQTYQKIHDMHKRAGKLREMTESLQAMLKVDPTHTPAYRELMDIAKAKGDRKGAAQLAVDMGQHLLKAGRTADALSAANEALMLDSSLLEAKTLRENAGGGASAIPAATPVSQPAPKAGGQSDMVATLSQNEYTIQKLIGDAEAALGRGDTGPALRNYEMAVEAGANRSDIFYSIGQLYAENGQVDRALENLTKATSDPEYAVSAFFMIGQVCSKAERHFEAANAYRDALDRIDLQTIGQEEAEELVVMYDSLVEALEKQNKPGEAADAYGKLVAFFRNRNFDSNRIQELSNRHRELMDKAKASEQNPSLADDEDAPLTSSIRFGGEEGDSFSGNSPIGSFAGSNGVARPLVVAAPTFPPKYPTALLDLEPNPTLAPYLRASEEFFRSNRINAAIDACHEMIRYYPEYIPAQAILAEIYVEQERVEQARLKYQYIVDVYQLRQEPMKSIESYKRLGELSPENQALRTKLANLLLQYDRKEDAAEILLTTVGNYVRTGQLERALEECKKLRQLSPQSASIRIQYAELLCRMERYNEAMPELRRAIELDADNLKALALLNITGFMINDVSLKWGSLQTLVERGRRNEASFRTVLEEYRQAVVLNANAGLHYVMAVINLELKQPKQAERLLKQTADTSQNVPAQASYEVLAYWGLGQLLLEQGRAAEAVETLEKVTGLLDKADPILYAPNNAFYGVLPSQITLYRKLSQAYQANGDPTQALKALKTVKKLMPFNREVHTELAELYFNQGQLTEALGELGELASHYEGAGKIDQMIDVLKEMATLAPNNIGVRDKLGEVYLKRGMIEEGLKELDELAELQRKNGRLKDAVRTLQRAAETYWMMNRQEDSYELYDRIVRISPGDVDARQHLVNRYLMAGRIQEAVEEQRTIAQICLQSNNNQDAIAALHQLIGLEPNDTRAYFQLAGVLSTTGEHQQAYRLYQRILRLDTSNEKAKTLMEQTYKKAVEAGQIKAE